MFRSLKSTPARLGPWATRLRGDVPGFGDLCRRPMASRLAVVFLTVLIVTMMMCVAGPPLGYRAGQSPARELRVRIPFTVVNAPQTDWVREATGQEESSPVLEHFPAGMSLARRGQPITDGQISLLRHEHRIYRQSLTFVDNLRQCIALFLIVLLLAAVMTLYVARFQSALAASHWRVVGMCSLIVATLIVGLLLSRSPWYALLAPLTVTALVLTIAYNPPFALLMSFSLSIVTSLALGGGIEQLLIQMAALGTAILLLRSVRTRTRLVQIGAGAGLASLLMTVATGMLGSQTWHFIAGDAWRNFLWCTLGGFIVCGALPLIERCFGVLTDVSLNELANSGHPLLQDLIRRAPGTYTHSMTVATLAESAAETIGANVLLVRVGSYFHDVGKMVKPQYFIENQTGTNRHDDLEPALSTLVIIGHVKDGMALADQHRLPKPVADMIQQHHGTTLVEYFYREAIRLSDGEASPALEATFRYPGPKPQSPEAGILMLADAVESASRSLTAPTAGSLRKLVHDLLMKRLLDGQFEESGLSLTDLHRIEKCLCRGLLTVFHSRIKYPDERLRRAS